MTRPGIREFALLFLLALMWGSSFTFIKIGVDAYSPLMVAAGRLAVGALVLWGFALIRKSALPKGRRAWVSIFFIALLGNAVPFFLISYGETHIDAGLAAILMSVVPLGTVGVIVLVGPETLSGLGGGLFYQLAVLIAAVCYAVASLVARNLRNQPRVGSSAVILTFAAGMLAPFSLIVDPPWQMAWDMDGFLSILYLGIFPTGIAMFLILYLIARAGASFVVFNNYLVPAVGVVVSFFVLQEIPQPTSVIALGLAGRARHRGDHFGRDCCVTGPIWRKTGNS